MRSHYTYTGQIVVMKRKLIFYINSYMIQNLDVKLYQNTEESVLPFRG